MAQDDSEQGGDQTAGGIFLGIFDPNGAEWIHWSIEFGFLYPCELIGEITMSKAKRQILFKGKEIEALYYLFDEGVLWHSFAWFLWTHL